MSPSYLSPCTSSEQVDFAFHHWVEQHLMCFAGCERAYLVRDATGAIATSLDLEFTNQSSLDVLRILPSSRGDRLLVLSTRVGWIVADGEGGARKIPIPGIADSVEVQRSGFRVGYLDTTMSTSTLADGAASRVVDGALPTGARMPGVQASGDLGIFADRSFKVSEKGLGIVERHLTQFGDVPENALMVERLRTSVRSGAPITGADASFYFHEVSEATMMGRGLSYEVAHPAALGKYGVSPFSVYHPEVISALPESFGPNWKAFWGLQ